MLLCDQLIPLDIQKDTHQVKEMTPPKLGGDVLKSHTGQYGSICYVVRRPGWPFCREEGLALTELKANDQQPLDGFDLWGVVKETGVDDQGLSDFADFYPFPLYRDDGWNFYKALGNRKISIPLNPFKLVGGIFSLYSMNSRVKEKKIEGNMTGEGMKQGGVIIFGKDGTPKYCYYEKTGNDLPLDDILAAIHAVKNEK